MTQVKSRKKPRRTYAHLSKILPHGAKSRIARELGVSHTCVKDVLAGVYENEVVLNAITREVARVVSEIVTMK